MKHIKYIPARGKGTGFMLMCAACAAGVGIGSLPAVGADCPWVHQYLSPSLCGDTVFTIFTVRRYWLRMRREDCGLCLR